MVYCPKPESKSIFEEIGELVSDLFGKGDKKPRGPIF